MSKFKAVTKMISGLLGGGMKAPSINIPAAEIPATPAPTASTDTGATVSLGVDTTKNDRVATSNTRKRKGATSIDILGGLGLGNIGINI